MLRHQRMRWSIGATVALVFQHHESFPRPRIHGCNMLLCHPLVLSEGPPDIFQRRICQCAEPLHCKVHTPSVAVKLAEDTGRTKLTKQVHFVLFYHRL